MNNSEKKFLENSKNEAAGRFWCFKSKNDASEPSQCFKMKNDASEPSQCLIFGVILLALVQVAAAIVMIWKAGGIWAGDFANNWRWTAYLMRGYLVEEAVKEPLAEIGHLVNPIVMPWGKLIGNLMFPGLVPYEAAKLWYYGCLLAASLLLAKFLFEWLKGKGMLAGGKGIVTAAALLFIPWYWYDAVHTGNPGALMGILALLSVFLIKKHKFIAALFLALSVCKPQVGGLFFLAYLLLKQWGILARAGAILGISWIGGELYTPIARNLSGLPSLPATSGAGDIVTIIIERMTAATSGGDGSGLEHLYFGIFDPLRQLGVPLLAVMLMSALAGVAFVFVGFVTFKDAGEDRLLLTVTFAALSSVFWTYKSQADGVVLGICNTILLWMALKKGGIRGKTPVIVIGLLLMNMKLCKYFLRFAFFWPHNIGVVGDMLLQILIFSWFVLLGEKMKQRDGSGVSK